MNNGIVKWYNATKGFGFIQPDAGGDDIFVHRSSIAPGEMLEDGQRVLYDVEPDRKDPSKFCAVNVRIA